MGLGSQGDGQRRHLLHLLPQQLLHRFLLGLRALHDQLVVYLHDEPGLQIFAAQAVIDPEHGQLHDVRRRALDGHVQRHTLAEGALDEIGGFQLRQRPAAVVQRLHIALLLGPGHHIVHILPHAGEGGEVALHVVLGLRHRHMDVLAEGEGGHAVHDAEVHCLGAGAHLVGDLALRHMEHLCRRDGV